MKLHAKLAILVTFLGLIGILIWRVAEPLIAQSQQAEVSDVGAKGTIHIGMDGWVGYFPLCSPEMKRHLNREGYGLRCTDDAADYSDRFKKLKSNDYQFVVGTVDSYLLNGKRYNYPGPIIAVIDESKGGDAMVAWESSVANLEALKNAVDIKVAYTPDSPSHHLIKAVATHFDAPALTNRANLIESEGSEAALDMFAKKKVDVAVVWEPEVSKALQMDGAVRLLGTEDTQQLIVDILIASQKVMKQEPEMVKRLLKSYFKTLKYYRENTSELVDALSEHYDISEKTAESLLKGVSWATLNDNAERWYGVDSQNYSSEALIETIESAAGILVEHDDFDRNPIPQHDPYLLVNSRMIGEMYKDFAKVGGFTSVKNDGRTGAVFNALSPQQWDLLKDIGSLKTRKISFSSGTADLTLEGKKQVDSLMNDLKHYPNFRVEIRGHTGLRGDPNANLMLSRSRANAVERYIEIAHTIEENRMRAVGFGASSPLPKKAGESNRAYNYRLPRVEIALVREVF